MLGGRRNDDARGGILFRDIKPKCLTSGVALVLVLSFTLILAYKARCIFYN